MSEFLVSINKLRQSLSSKPTEEKGIKKEQQELLNLSKDLKKSRRKSLGDSDNFDGNNDEK